MNGETEKEKERERESAGSLLNPPSSERLSLTLILDHQEVIEQLSSIE